ncbi:hypothetical protein [Candidatus Poriferisodalis sp.]|uniref:hypothetical protein n=1 Tax=Candidatus Poriferisodalis sp. TaxID=3101277 RepID=UPI003B01FC04
MTTPIRILLVDDDVALAESVAGNIQQSLAGRLAVPFDEAAVDTEHDFGVALEHLSNRKFDVLILDILRDSVGGAVPEDAGREVFEGVRCHQFLPIIFYAGDPSAIGELVDPPFVQAVEKGPNVEELLGAVVDAVNSGLPSILRRIHDSVDETVRDFVETFVTRNWQQIEDSAPDIAYLLARQLSTAFDLNADQIAEAVAEVPDDERASVPSDAIHPHRYYVAQPQIEYATGDIYRASPVSAPAGDAVEKRYLVLLTPTCDLVGLGSDDNMTQVTKADFVLMGTCRPVEEFDQFAKWQEGIKDGSPSNSSRQRLERLLTSRPEHGQADRYFFLPAAWGLPDLLVDLQQVASMQLDDFLELDKVASLDSPFAQALSQQYVRFVGRIGVPDLNLRVTLDRMQRSVAETDDAD